MKRLVFFFLMAFPALVFSQNRFPDYKSVMTKFFTLYHHENSATEMLNFARKKEGWYVQLLNPAKRDSIVSNQLFWSQQKGRYQVLENFVGSEDNKAGQKVIDQTLAAFYGPYGYERCIYYGYDGWDIDIIKDFGNTANAGDTLLESLARAYSHHITRFTWYQYGGRVLSDDTLQRKLDRLQMPGDERVKKMIEYADKAIASYEKIYRRNKSYRCFAGSIESKYFDEIMHGWLQMSLSNRPAEAENFLARGHLPNEDSLLATNLFAAVPPDAILFTFGDNDTYSLYFMQEKLNYRKDVTVVHGSLLGLPAYIDLLKRKYNLPFASTAAEYGSKNFEYAFFSGRPSGKTVKLPDFIAQRKNLPRVPATGGDSVQVYHEKLLYMPFSKDSLKMQLQDFLRLNEFIMLDIVAANLDKRPIYFTYPWPLMPSENMKETNNVWQLVPRQ